MNKRIIISLAALLGAALCLNAQSFQEGFFLRNYNLAYQYNPAFVGNNDFLSAGKLGYSIRNNVGAGSFLFPDGGSLLTGLNSSIPAETFPGALPENSRINGMMDISLVSYGFRRGDAFHTIELNLRGTADVSVSKEVFGFLKQGTGLGTVDLGRFHVEDNVFAELAYGYGRKVNDWLSLGARAKLLVPVQGAGCDVTRLDVTASQELLLIGFRGRLDMTGSPDKKKRFWLNGGGLAVDLGIVATPAEGLTMSLSLLDLGGMFWHYGKGYSSVGSFAFKGFDKLGSDQLNGQYLKEYFLEKGMDFVKSLEPMQQRPWWEWQWLPVQANLGIKYEMPFYRRLALGATGRYLGSAFFPYWEGRFGLEINPVDWLDLTGNFGKGTQGLVYGFAATVKVCRFRLTAGYQNGCSGTVPYSSIPIGPNFKSMTLSLTYDL